MSANRHERLASETAEERTVRLQQMSANQHEKLASETAEEREVWLRYYIVTGTGNCTGDAVTAAIQV